MWQMSRGQRGVTPTLAGEMLLRPARHILRGFEGLRAELVEHAKSESGYGRLLADVSSLSEFVPEAPGDFLLAHPKIRVDLEERTSAEVARGVADGSAEIGICRDGVPTQELDLRVFRHDHFAAIVSSAHPLAGRGMPSFSDTLEYDRIGLWSDASMVPLLQRIAAASDREWRVRMHVSTFDAAFRLLRTGSVIDVLPREAVELFADACGLRAVPLADAWARRAFVICVRSAGGPSPAARRLYDHLLGHPGEEDCR